MKEEITQDLKTFGDCYVYCSQHLNPHKTGWCTVPDHEKIKLESKTLEKAFDECRKLGYTLY